MCRAEIRDHRIMTWREGAECRVQREMGVINKMYSNVKTALRDNMDKM